MCGFWMILASVRLLSGSVYWLLKATRKVLRVSKWHQLQKNFLDFTEDFRTWLMVDIGISSWAKVYSTIRNSFDGVFKWTDRVPCSLAVDLILKQRMKFVQQSGKPIVDCLLVDFKRVEDDQAVLSLLNYKDNIGNFIVFDSPSLKIVSINHQLNTIQWIAHCALRGVASHEVAFIAVDAWRWQILRRKSGKWCTKVETAGIRRILTVGELKSSEPVHNRIENSQPPSGQTVIAVAFHSCGRFDELDASQMGLKRARSYIGNFLEYTPPKIHSSWLIHSS